MNQEYIAKILDKIDELFANATDKNGEIINQKISNQIAEQIISLNGSFDNDRQSQLYIRFRTVSNAFLLSMQKSSQSKEAADDAIKYFEWLKGEKKLASGEKLTLDLANRMKHLAEETGHIQDKRVEEFLYNNSLPQKNSFINKLKAKIRNIFRKNNDKTNVDYQNLIKSQDKEENNFRNQIAYNVQENYLINKRNNEPELIVISDIHGRLDKWNFVKQLLNRNPNVKLIIEGDSMDRGQFGLQILMQIKELCDQGRAEYLPGNHDSFAYDVLATEGTCFERLDFVNDSKATWENNGGKVTKEAFKNFEYIMSNELQSGNIKRPITKQELISWLGSRPIQKIVNNGDKSYALAHAVFDEKLYKIDPNFTLEKALKIQLRGESESEIYKRFQNIMWFRENDEDVQFAPISFPKGCIMVVGHTRQKSANIKYLENDPSKPIVYLDCGRGELQGLSLNTGKSIQIEPEERNM